MQYKPLGRTGLKVSQLCFGTMSFGGDASVEQSEAMFNACVDEGINFFDCADAYSLGRAEEILGDLIQGKREKLVITSKCFVPMSDEVISGGANRRHIISAVEASLKRLKTDWLDVLFMHRWDNFVPLEETLRALEKLVSDGKVNYLGASNYAAWQIAKGLGISEKNGWSRFDVIQPMYSLVKRQAEVEIFPLARAENLGVLTYSPVGGGLLSGKYSRGARQEEGRITQNKEYEKRYREDWVYEVAEEFTEIATENDVHPVTLAVSWVAANPAVSCPIIGARNIEQLRPSLDAAKWTISPELYAAVSNISRTPPPATDRLEEQG
ncbi:aldo/keto reductase [Ruegeria sp. 2205SS24-7]|uniref:aldo/keto reductase n=1 Tax=Ruegeria discodermiae TaxID=3064389 RepID=UPI00274159B4|nr:aldo/keto reductase [Ruegeria sp. 2205SS24-7]MDP5218937.1 aldo/keto reductase [Ruegeria sp. 2205SS24-7]